MHWQSVLGDRDPPALPDPPQEEHLVEGGEAHQGVDDRGEGRALTACEALDEV